MIGLVARGEGRSHVVVDGWGVLGDAFGDDIEYARTAAEAVDLLLRRREQGRPIGQLWLAWDLLGGETSHAVVDLIVETDVKDNIATICFLSDNPERRAQAYALLHPWFPEWDRLDCMARRDSILSEGPDQPPPAQPIPGLSLIERLRAAGVRIDPGLSDAEVGAVQERHGFVFAAPHRRLLQEGLPVDTYPGQESWPHWRLGDPERLDQWIERTPLAHPLTGERNEPAAPLIPLWHNRFHPSGQDRTAGPVLSVLDDRDMLYWAPDLAGWIDLDFDGGSWTLFRLPAGMEVPYWSSIVERDDERVGDALWAPSGVRVVAELGEEECQ